MYSLASPFVLIHLISYASQVQNEKINTYEGAQVWRTTLRGSSDILMIKRLVDNQDISIWNLTPKRAEFLVQSNHKLKVNRLLNSQNLNHTVVIMDVQRRVDAQRSEPVFWDEKTLRMGHRLNWNEYPTLEIIEEYFVYLAENFASICQVINAGYTSENRTIKIVKISNGNPENKVIVITSGLHAREWIAVTSALYTLDSIVTKFDQLPRFMKNKEWIIIPLLNPDGFKYSHTHDRLWRNNRRPINNCKGVDINRNFEVDWDIDGISVKEECFDGYSGPHPFSEAESVVLRNTMPNSFGYIHPSTSFDRYKVIGAIDLILQSEKKPDALMDLHSYGQLILYPWSAKPELVNDGNLHKNTAGKITSAIYNSTGERYKSGVTYHTVYPATGAAIDWAYSAGVPQTFALEAGNDGFHGFLIPPERIEDIGKEVFAAVKELAKVIDPDFVNRGTDYEYWFK